MEKLVMQLFEDIYRGKRVLLTGHTGFKGSWLQRWLEMLGAEVTGLSLAPNTSPSHFRLLQPGGISCIADIADDEAVKNIVATARPDIVFHLAAQPLVRRSYTAPDETFLVNVMGTVRLYEAIRSLNTVKAIVNITTDKVYQNHGAGTAYNESDALGGHDPYSTSKACVELVHDAYRKSFFKQAGIRSATARAGNVIGGGDWAEDRLIPDLVRAAAIGQSTDIRNPGSVRPWQHVLDPLSGYLLLGQHLLFGNDIADDAWNFGPAIEDCLPVAEVIDLFSKHWEGIRWNDRSAGEKLHESAVLRLDCTKAKEQLHWQPVWGIGESVKKTAEWYKQYYMQDAIKTEADIKQYIADAAVQQAVWVS